MSDVSSDHTHLKIMAGIGFVCVEWSLLETLTLGTIAATEGLPLDKVYMLFGSLDMKPRLDMAYNLAISSKVPVYLCQRIKAVRTTLNVEKLANRRNQAVHGAHGVILEPDSIELLMVRWNGTRRVQRVTTAELHQLGERLNGLANEMHAISAEIYEWKIRVLQNRAEYAERQAITANTPIWLRVAREFPVRVRERWESFRK